MGKIHLSLFHFPVAAGRTSYSDVCLVLPLLFPETQVADNMVFMNGHSISLLGQHKHKQILTSH